MGLKVSGEMSQAQPASLDMCQLPVSAWATAGAVLRDALPAVPAGAQHMQVSVRTCAVHRSLAQPRRSALL
jgi:hypothetical protein